jgi:hypothetical protein
MLGPATGLSYTFVYGGVTPVADQRDAEAFLRMGTPETGNYLYREVDASGAPVGLFPPVNPENRQSNVNPRSFPSDDIRISVKEWRDATEDLADPWLYYYYVRRKLSPP